MTGSSTANRVRPLPLPKLAELNVNISTQHSLLLASRSMLRRARTRSLSGDRVPLPRNGNRFQDDHAVLSRPVQEAAKSRERERKDKRALGELLGVGNQEKLATEGAEDDDVNDDRLSISDYEEPVATRKLAKKARLRGAPPRQVHSDPSAALHERSTWDIQNRGNESDNPLAAKSLKRDVQSSKELSPPGGERNATSPSSMTTPAGTPDPEADLLQRPSTPTHASIRPHSAARVRRPTQLDNLRAAIFPFGLGGATKATERRQADPSSESSQLKKPVEKRGFSSDARDYIRQRDMLHRYQKEVIPRLKEQLSDREKAQSILHEDLMKKETRIIELQSELASSKAFVESDDAGDVQDVKDQLARISSLIDDLSFALADDIPLLPVSSTPSFFFTSSKILSTIIVDLITADLTLQHYVHFASSSLICHFVYREVFSRFKPGLSIALDDSLLACYSQIRRGEDQARAARWRSITFSNVLASGAEGDSTDEATLAETMALALFRILDTELLQPLSSLSPKVELSQPNNVIQSLRDVLLQSLKWHARVRKVYLSADYIAMVEPHSIDQAGPEGLVAINAFGLMTRTAMGKGKPEKEQWLEKVGGWRRGELEDSG